MDVEGPAPGEELNTGAPTEPRQAASVIVLRGGDDALEVLLLRRNPESRFMGGAWVFPGGAVDVCDVAEGDRDEGASRLAGETDLDASHRVAAVREVEEEAGLRLPDPAALVKFSRWITPPQITIRYDTHFFLAPVPPGQEPRADGEEMIARLAHARGSTGGAPPRRARPRLPDDQAPRAAGGVRVGDRADRLGRRPRGRRGRAARDDHRRDGAGRAAGRAGLLAAQAGAAA
jgi:8-oxo-dGTP pyrophosphatase MutT (NUDIX family)